MKLLTLLLVAAGAKAVTITVSKSGGIEVSPLQYGLMFEDINHSGDGGIYAELINNRAFQSDNFTAATLSPWTAVGGASLTLQTTDPPLSSALPHSVNVQGPAGSTIGISNPGYWGIEVKPQAYTGSFYVTGAYRGEFVASLVGLNGHVYASASIPSKSVASAWTEHSFKLFPSSSAPNTNNTFQLTYKPTSSSQSLNFGLISLFPPTYNNRPNGMRSDIMNLLKELNPSFLRLPGGNNIEGNVPNDGWRWYNTVGPLKDRPGRTGTWGYYNTDGLGLIEYMHWCQDLNMKPILAVFSGLSLDGSVVPQADLEPYVQDALNELEFLMGDHSTHYGAQRIALGYPEPFPIEYVEIGNEDNLWGGQDSYSAYRFSMFYDAIHAKYPEIVIISSSPTWPELGTSAGDYHQYSTPDGFQNSFHSFDNLSTTNLMLLGEYAAVQPNLITGQDTNWNEPFSPYPFWLGAVGEAIYQIGSERNANKIIGMSYAPGLENRNSFEWQPDLISFVADTSQTLTSTSWEQIKLFSNNRFTTVLPDSSSSSFNPAYWVAGFNQQKNSYMFKAAVYNTSSTSIPFTVRFPDLKAGDSATLTVLTSNDGPDAQNVPRGPNVVNTAVTTIRSKASGFTFSLPELSIAILSTNSR